jgi:adenine-specific DNA-methyltransferase
MTTDPGDLVLDPTCGSGTTAYVAEEWGRRWITIDTSRVALSLARIRLMEGKYPYYLLADSPAGVMKEAELANDLNRAVDTKTSGDIKKGFVYERVPHITLKSIANNPEIDDIHAKWQKDLEPLRAEINSLAGENWEEWEIPRPESTLPEAVDESTRKCNKAIETWWELRGKRQEAIDDAIARHSEGEILYDKPSEDKKRLRITGPFTVESLSPHRVLSSDEGTNDRLSQPESLSFEQMILENLKKAGVQNTVKDERLNFDWIEPYAGEWIHAEGEYVENGETKRAAFSIGPEHGTVGPELIKEAAKEAVQGLGFDLLIVCGFAFDPHVSEERTRYGKLTVLNVRMNTDLTMGDEVLKKTGAGNLFMVFGEPDVEIETQPNGKVVVEVKGVDVYDPTTGLVRSNSTDDMACWFIDTNYNGESFFVRHAYFTGEDKPYDNLKRTLKAEIDEAVWETLYRTRSRPFDKPLTGEIAVKVINHYGDEVLKVYNIK